LVVAYSSGENETISLPYIKMKLFQYDQYLKDLKDKVSFSKPKSSLLYIDYEMSQAVLLTILLFFDFGDKKKKNVLDILQEEINISGMQQFTINLKNNLQELVAESTDNKLIEVETVFVKEDNKNYIGRILDYLQEQIDKLKDCATCKYEKGDYTAYSFLVDENTKKLIRNKFVNDPYSFFSIFQILHSLNERVEKNEYKYEVYNSKGFYTDYKRPTYSHFFYFTHYYINKNQEKRLLRELSDGEQQFLHTLGICLMLQKKRALLLLDEPETHFNPDWRSKFIDILRRTLQASNDNFMFKDIVLTSHSPFIISDCFPDKVIVFEKDKQPQSAYCKNFRTFGTSVDIIMENVFKRNNTIGDFSAKIIYEIEKEIKNKKKLTEEQVRVYKDKTSDLGDSIEKILLFTKLNELKKR
jgi:restriction system-associated AAA family ATPase